MITLSIAAILLTLAVPSFTDFTKNNRLITQTNDFVTSLNLARSEAVRRGDRVTVCKSSDQATCAASGTWDQGWIVFADVNGNGVVTNAATNILRVHAGLSGSVVLKSSALPSYVSYVSSGATQQIGSFTTQSGLLAMCDDRGLISNAEGIQISATGRVSSGSLTGIAGVSCSP